jgi:hypothetical protein
MTRVPSTGKRGAGALPPSNPPAPLPSIDRKTDLKEVAPMMTPGEFSAHLYGTRHGPHDDDTATAVAALTAEAMRYLAYATRPRSGGVTSPVTVYDVATELASAAGRMPQILTQLADWLNIEDTAGRIAGGGAASTVEDARTALAEARYAAERLYLALSEVVNATASLRPADGGEDQ